MSNYRTMLQGRVLPCDREMIEIRGIGKYIDTGYGIKTSGRSEQKLYQCESCKTIKLV
jgi:hypothetical protein